ncbi:MAG: hypothetical protein V2A76_11745 [Planctomycetota bacterium]
MNKLREKVAHLRENLEAAIMVEQELAERLRGQEKAMLEGVADQIHAANSALDRVYDELRQVAETCRRAVADLHVDLDLTMGVSLGKVIASLPQNLVPELEGSSRRLRQARVTARSQSSRNVTIARTSLDAIASIRGIFGAAHADQGGTHNSSPSLSRLDAQA